MVRVCAFRARVYPNLFRGVCQVKRHKMSRGQSRAVYRKASDRTHRKNLVSAIHQRGGIRL